MKYFNKVSLAVATLLLASTEVSAVQLDREPLLSWSPTPKDAAFKMNYAVPHLGTDDDVLNVKQSIAAAEKIEGHKWEWKNKKYLDHTRNGVPPAQLAENQILDEDMADSLKNADDAEKSTGEHWTGDGMYA